MAARTTHIVDISHHQPDPVNFEQLKSGGLVGVIFKATEGTSYVDDKWRAREAAAHAAGLKTATYHFFHGNAEKEMAHYLNEVQPALGERVVIDHEDSDASLAELMAAVQYLMDARPDLQITIYSGHLIKEQLGSAKNDFLAANTSLWLAQYTSGNPSWPKGTWPNWSLWQFTESGTIQGVTGAVDLNTFNGSAENAAKWMGPTAPAPEPEPITPTEPDRVTLAITVPKGVAVSVTINGVPMS
jgi:lysozyme